MAPPGDRRAVPPEGGRRAHRFRRRLLPRAGVRSGIVTSAGVVTGAAVVMVAVFALFASLSTLPAAWPAESGRNRRRGGRTPPRGRMTPGLGWCAVRPGAERGTFRLVMDVCEV